MLRNEFNCYFSFWVIFYPLPPWQPKKSKFRKNEKKSWRYNHFTIVYQKSWSYAILFMRYDAWQRSLFFILGHFLPFYPHNSPKNQNFKKMKQTPDRCNCYFSFWAIFCPFTPYQPKKSKFQKMKTRPGDIIILHLCTKNYDQMMYGSWDMVCDRRSNRQTDRKSNI